jgi:broad specificity phosphatase PhoE
MRLVFVRHAESEGNARGVAQGLLDFGLTDAGRAQAEALAVRLKARTVDRLVSSPLRRSAETAAVIAAALGLTVEFDDGLKEYDIGEVSGLTGAQIRERYPEVIAAYQKGIRPAFPGEEGREAFDLRVQAVLGRLQEHEGTVVAVAHGGVITAVCALVAGIETRRLGAFEMANCAITEIGRDRAGRLVLLRQNDTCHLKYER